MRYQATYSNMFWPTLAPFLLGRGVFSVTSVRLNFSSIDVENGVVSFLPISSLSVMPRGSY